MILTLIDGRTNTEIGDVEIPDRLSSLEFRNQWVKGEMDQNGAFEPQGYILEGKEPGGSWFSIPDDMVLADSGLQTGSFLRMKSIYSTVTIPVQEESSIPLFRDRNV